MNGINTTLRVALIASVLAGGRVRAQDEMRVWKSQEGRELKAAMLELKGTELTLRLENGAVSKVALSRLSADDQIFAKQAATNPIMAATVPAAAKVPAVPLVWPSVVVVNPKALDIAVGKQNAVSREYQYNSGSFLYIAKAPLTGTVMKDVAVDFELAWQFMAQLPWGWQPRPKDGGTFKVYLTETLQDFIDLGGNDTSGGGSKDDYVFTKFSELGLKKVGPRYAFDAREKNEGSVMGLTIRLLIGDMRSLLEPWSSIGLEEFTRKVAYHKGTIKLSRLETSLKAAIAGESRTKPDLKRMMEYLHMPLKEQRGDVKQIRVENYFDGMMLVYYFGFLDGDGKGARLHQYYRAAAQESLAWREFRETNGKTPRPRPAGVGSYPEWAAELMKIVLAGRSDPQIAAEMVAKFKAMGIKID